MNSRSGVIRSLQSLAMRARSTTPYALLSDAVGLLNVRAQLRQRFKAGADRAQANIDVFLDMSRAYDVRGLRAFARDMRANWEDAVRQVEGRPDAEEQSVALITIHASKGLEWPIVIPINMTGAPKSDPGSCTTAGPSSSRSRSSDCDAADYAEIKDWNAEELAANGSGSGMSPPRGRAISSSCRATLAPLRDGRLCQDRRF